MKVIKTKSGFTLIELMIVLVISSILVLACLALLMDFIRIRKSAHYNQEMLRNTELVFSFLTEDLHNAKSVNYSNDELKIVTFGDETVVYTVDQNSHQITRASQVITSSDLTIKNFSVNIINPESSIPLVLLDLDISTNINPDQVFSRQTTISLRTNRTDIL